MKRSLLLILLLCAVIQPKKQCRPVKRFHKYFKIKSCYRSMLPLLSSTNANSVEDCMIFTRQKNALAFNFIPRDAQPHIEGPIVNCHVLSCAEILTSSTLVPDLSFDYYSAYGNATGNATCMKNIGVFTVRNVKENYWNSINNCQKIGADLADVSSETRTRYLSKVINSSLQGWYKVAYVGMDDIEQEGSFVTVSDSPLTCSTFRAWAPGHPRSSKEHEDCVVLDAERLWRVVDCRTELPSLCEFYPDKPMEINDLVNISCVKIRDKCVFTVRNVKENYWNAINNCQKIGADLADVSSETRTRYLSKVINSSLQGWYKVAYVGMDDIEQEGSFVTVSDSPLTCFTFRFEISRGTDMNNTELESYEYLLCVSSKTINLMCSLKGCEKFHYVRRAWAPGHPRSSKEHEDCVVLDAERLWRVVDCRTELPSLCEFYPDKPMEINDLVNISCVKIRDKSSKKKCEDRRSLYKLFESSPRSDRCAIINYEDNSPLMSL